MFSSRKKCLESQSISWLHKSFNGSKSLRNALTTDLSSYSKVNFLRTNKLHFFVQISVEGNKFVQQYLVEISFVSLLLTCWYSEALKICFSFLLIPDLIKYIHKNRPKLYHQCFNRKLHFLYNSVHLKNRFLNFASQSSKYKIFQNLLNWTRLGLSLQFYFSLQTTLSSSRSQNTVFCLEGSFNSNNYLYCSLGLSLDNLILLMNCFLFWRYSAFQFIVLNETLVSSFAWKFLSEFSRFCWMIPYLKCWFCLCVDIWIAFFMLIFLHNYLVHFFH